MSTATATTAPTTTTTITDPPLLGGTTVARWQGPFACAGCDQPTRPPKRLASEPGMEGTKSYGGRGYCTSCYSVHVPNRRPRNKPAARKATDAQMAYTLAGLNSFMQRRTQRLSAGGSASLGMLAQRDRQTA